MLKINEARTAHDNILVYTAGGVVSILVGTLCAMKPYQPWKSYGD